MYPCGISEFLSLHQLRELFSLWCLTFCVFNGLLYQCECKEVEESSSVVSTEYGMVQGINVKNHIEFRGIPYAKKPLGALRFKPPEKPLSWKNDEPLLADQFPEYCIQFNVFWNATEGQEDCLYLNVFIPNSSLHKEMKLPVMVYIHPGGFMFGRGSQFRGEYLVEMENVIVVTFQYRLGSFGFLNTGDKESRGNMGMKDQVLALQWVRDNIVNFGGNPETVTIFGTSAGAASVHYHILSPMSKGLFKSAISSSGTALCPWAFQPNPVTNARHLAKLLNCPQENLQKLVECLREKDASEIANAHSQFIHWYTDPISAFSPSVETIVEGETHFLIEEPAVIIKDGRISNSVPWIIMFNSDEGYDHSYGIFRNSKFLNDLNENWLRIFPSTFEYDKKEDSLKNQISKRVKQFYFKGQPVSHEHLQNLTNAYSDTTFVHCTIQSAIWHAQTQNVHLCKFNYKGQHSILNLRGIASAGFAVNHMDDLQFTMNSILFPFLDESHPDKDFQKRYLKMLTYFAKSGKMTFLGNNSNAEEYLMPLKPSDGIKWYRIDDDSEMETCSDEFSERMKFWDEIHDHNYKFLQRATEYKDEL